MRGKGTCLYQMIGFHLEVSLLLTPRPFNFSTLSSLSLKERLNFISSRKQSRANRGSLILIMTLQVDDKYEYSMESKDIKVHGWISTNNSVGFWQITPSNEFRSAGPVKQFLGSHVGPTNLAVSIGFDIKKNT